MGKGVGCKDNCAPRCVFIELALDLNPITVIAQLNHHGVSVKGTVDVFWHEVTWLIHVEANLSWRFAVDKRGDGEKELFIFRSHLAITHEVIVSSEVPALDGDAVNLIAMEPAGERLFTQVFHNSFTDFRRKHVHRRFPFHRDVRGVHLRR